MLYCDVRRMLKLRGVERPHAFLVKNGFVSQTANNLVHNNVTQIKVEHIEKLCVLLNCMPSDLFSWNPDNDAAAPENHPLKPLHRNKPSEKLDVMLRKLPAAKMDKLAAFIDELNNEEAG